MSVSAILSAYIGRHFLVSVLSTIALFLLLIFIGDAIELLRRAGPRPDATIDVVLLMALFKLPHMAEKILPFAVLFGAMYSFWRLSKTQELVAARAVGVSVWQFLGPPFLVAALIGVLHVTAFNPVASVLMTRYEQMDNEYLRGRTSVLNISSSGLWLRQATPEGQAVIHARSVRQPQGVLRLSDVTVFEFTEDNSFNRRIEAGEGALIDGSWQLQDAWVFLPTSPVGTRRETFELQTALTLDKIQDSFASPQTMSFWDLRPFITLLEEAGFNATRHQMHFHSLLAQPVLLAAMVLIAVTFSARHTRRGGAAATIGGGVAAGFMLFFFSDIISALGVAGNLPVLLAAWLPAALALLAGTASLLFLEDG